MLSNCLGLPVVDEQGQRLGKLRDLVVTGGEHPRVTALLVSAGRQRVETVGWERVRDVGGDSITVGRGASSPPSDGVQLRLKRDVLDAQVIDLAGRRLVRVADVALEQADGAMTVQGIAVDMHTLVGRLLPHRRGWVQEPAIVDWKDIHVASARGHTVQLRVDRGLTRRAPDEVGELLARLPAGRAAEVLRSVGPSRGAKAMESVAPGTAAAVLSHVDHDLREATLAEMPADRVAEIRRLLTKRAPARRRHRSRFGKVLSVRRRAPS